MEENPIVTSTAPSAPENPPVQPPSPDQPPAVPPEPVSKPKNWPAIYLSILLVAALSVAGYFAYQNSLLQNAQVPSTINAPTTALETPAPIPTVDPTADWETFKNTTYNYSFKYPQGFTVGQNGQNHPNPETVSHIIASAPDNKGAFSISITQLESQTLKQAATSHYNKLANYIIPPNQNFPEWESNQPVKEFEATRILNEEAYTYTIKGTYVDDGGSEGAGETPVERTYYWVSNNNNAYLIRIDQIKPIDQILSTFEFTN